MNPIERFETETVNGEVNTKWRNSYEGVTRTNTVLYNVRNITDLPADAAKRIEGEARFLRGHYYFELKKNFNMVPWIDETTNLPSIQADKELATKSSIRNDMDIWPKIEEDFKWAYDNLPETQGLSRPGQQVGRRFLPGQGLHVPEEVCPGQDALRRDHSPRARPATARSTVCSPTSAASSAWPTRTPKNRSSLSRPPVAPRTPTTPNGIRHEHALQLG
jgi:hypothetical protein